MVSGVGCECGVVGVVCVVVSGVSGGVVCGVSR